MTRPSICPHCGGDLSGQDDGRAGTWRYRVRLYDMEVNPDEPMVDSDADLAPDKPGRETIRGLWRVLTDTATAAAEHHGGQQLRGLGPQDQERKLRGIRPTLSRNKGRATFRIGYDTPASWRDNPNHEPRYLARVDVLKEQETANAT
jgi:hypothetical protein